MNILLTGSTSQQCNPQANKNVCNYAGLLRRAFHASGHDVYWSEPSISWQGKDLLPRYDHVVVGLAPVTSLSANRIYGALSIIDRMLTLNPSKLSILLDSPEPERISAGNRAILAHPENLTKIFYSYRKEYELAVMDRVRLLEVIQRLHEDTWPTTVMPALPWETDENVQAKHPYLTKRAVPLNLDSLLFSGIHFMDSYGRQNTWTSEGAVKQPVTFPLRPILHKGHAARDMAVMRQMATSAGVLIEAPKAGLWWNSRYVQGLSTHTPVFSNWAETAPLGEAWTVLPMMIETMSPLRRAELARAQMTQYQDACSGDETIKDRVHSIVRARAKVSV